MTLKASLRPNARRMELRVLRRLSLGDWFGSARGDPLTRDEAERLLTGARPFSDFADLWRAERDQGLCPPSRLGVTWHKNAAAQSVMDRTRRQARRRLENRDARPMPPARSVETYVHVRARQLAATKPPVPVTPETPPAAALPMPRAAAEIPPLTVMLDDAVAALAAVRHTPRDEEPHAAEEFEPRASVLCRCGAQWHGAATVDNPDIVTHLYRCGPPLSVEEFTLRVRTAVHFPPHWTDVECFLASRHADYVALEF